MLLSLLLVIGCKSWIILRYGKNKVFRFPFQVTYIFIRYRYIFYKVFL